MIQTSKLKVNRVLSGAALLVATGFLACSSPAPNTGGFPQDPGTNTSNGNGGDSTSNGAAGTGSSGGSATASSSGSSGSSSGGAATSTSSSSGSSGGTAAEAGAPPASSDGIPTTPGVSVGPTGATDLAVPDPSVGMQMATPPMAFSVAPNQEIFPNYCVTVPNDIQVGGFQSWMSIGSSHHFILYKGGTVAAGTAPSTSCSLGANAWIYASSTPGQVVTENMPPNVGLAIAKNTQLILNLHFINPGTTTMYPQVKMNLLYAKDVKYEAGTMVSFNTQINVPAASASGPGTQTVNGTCSAPTGANFFQMSTHTHKHATAAWVDFIHNGATQEIVHTGATSTYPADQEMGSGTDWEHPGVGLWVTPNFLTIQSGDSFTYHCSYSNTGTQAVTVGETATYNEMCMAVGYYFPAGAAACQ
jgi:Copper type II ascorbate-dependent monooxygenase, C-terminal domain